MAYVAKSNDITDQCLTALVDLKSKDAPTTTKSFELPKLVHSKHTIVIDKAGLSEGLHRAEALIQGMTGRKFNHVTGILSSHRTLTYKDVKHNNILAEKSNTSEENSHDVVEQHLT